MKHWTRNLPEVGSGITGEHCASTIFTADTARGIENLHAELEEMKRRALEQTAAIKAAEAKLLARVRRDYSHDEIQEAKNGTALCCAP